MRLTSLAPLALVLLLAGCTPPPPPVAEPEPTPVVTESAMPEPTPEPTIAAPAPDFGFTFFRGTDLGSTFASAGATPIAECPYLATLEHTDADYTAAFTDSEAPEGPVSFFYTNLGDLAAVASAPRNAEGVGVGSTRAELLAAYPDAVVGSTHDIGAGDIATVTVEDPTSDSRYVFGFQGESPNVNMLQWGTLAGIQWSHLCGGF